MLERARHKLCDIAYSCKQTLLTPKFGLAHGFSGKALKDDDEDKMNPITRSGLAAD